MHVCSGIIEYQGKYYAPEYMSTCNIYIGVCNIKMNMFLGEHTEE